MVVDSVVLFFTVVYSVSMLLLLLFSLTQLDLLLIYLRKPSPLNPIRKPLVPLPVLTVQLPVYNEKFVILRSLDAIAALTYPKELLEIQVLDDSTDETSVLIDDWVAAHEGRGINIKIIRRTSREGYKAGALAEGLRVSAGEYVAIFDADFIPPVDFFDRTLQLFADNEVGVVQTRWGHLNEQENLLTRLQAFGLDAHFTIEQNARMRAGSYMNFNGTAGIWRRACIESAGGWSADTLTEDLDLSYRAQLTGWKIVYDGTVVCPAELPSSIRSVMAQQGRWNKGGAETAAKLLGRVLKAPGSVRKKIHAFFHLCASSVFAVLFTGAVSSIFLYQLNPDPVWMEKILDWGMFSFTGFLAIFFFYLVSGRSNNQRVWLLFPSFLLLNMGLSLRHSVAVVSGWRGKKSAFVRTPKFSGHATHASTYLQQGSTPSAFPELNCGIVFLWMAILSFQNGLMIFTLFHFMMGIGFSWVGLLILRDR